MIIFNSLTNNKLDESGNEGGVRIETAAEEIAGQRPMPTFSIWRGEWRSADWGSEEVLTTIQAKQTSHSARKRSVAMPDSRRVGVEPAHRSRTERISWCPHSLYRNPLGRSSQSLATKKLVRSWGVTQATAGGGCAPTTASVGPCCGTCSTFPTSRLS